MKKTVAFIVLSLISQISASEKPTISEDIRLQALTSNIVVCSNLNQVMKYIISSRVTSNNITIEVLKNIIVLQDINFNRSPITVALKLYPIFGVKALQALKEVTQTNDRIHPDMKNSINTLDHQTIRSRIKDMTAGFRANGNPVVFNNNGKDLIKFVYSGADVSYLKDALMVAFNCDNESKTHLFELLILAGVDLNFCNRVGDSVLMNLVYDYLEASASVTSHAPTRASATIRASVNLKLIHLLLSAGADVDKRGELGKHPLLNAIYYNDVDLAQLLLQHNSDVDQAEFRHGTTPLLAAIRKSNKKIVHLLMAKGADINKPDVHGDTPLISAVKNNDKTMVKLLLAFEADIFAKNRMTYENRPNAELTPSQKEIMVMLHDAKLEAERTYKAKKCSCTVS